MIMFRIFTKRWQRYLRFEKLCLPIVDECRRSEPVNQCETSTEKLSNKKSIRIRFITI